MRLETITTWARKAVSSQKLIFVFLVSSVVGLSVLVPSNEVFGTIHSFVPGAAKEAVIGQKSKKRSRVKRKRRGRVKRASKRQRRGSTKRAARRRNSKKVEDLLSSIPKSKKRSRAIPKVQLRERRAKRVDAKRIRPVRTAALRFSSGDSSRDERALERTLDKQIRTLFRAIQEYGSGEDREGLLLRLSELYVERAALIDLRTQRRLDKALEAWEKKKRKGRAPKVGGRKEIRDFILKAIEMNKWYLKDYPKGRRADQALLFLGNNYVELGLIKQGAKYYEELAKKFPKSRYIRETHFALGEHYFDKEQWKTALKHYRYIIKDKNSKNYSVALYKVAWCNYRMGKVRTGIRYLERVLAHARTQKERIRSGGLRADKVRLAEEAENALVPFYADILPYRNARGYFLKKAGRKRLFYFLEKLAFEYSKQGKRVQARYIFKQLLDMRPMSPLAFDYQYEIVTNYEHGGNHKTFRAELYTWIRNYGANSAWAKANRKNTALLKEAYEKREGKLRQHVLQLHQAAQKSRAPYSQSLSETGYKLYLSEFPKSKNYIEMKFYYGELLYEMKKYKRASTQYLWVANNAPKSKYHEDAYLNAVLSLEKLLPAEKKVDPEDLSLRPYTEVESQFSKVGSQFVQTYPKAESALEMQFKLARMAYVHYDFEKAVPLFQSVIDKNPKSKYAVYSANLILDIYNLKKDYDGLAKVGKELLERKGLRSSDLEIDVQDVVERANFKKAQDAEVAKDYLGSAKLYEKFVKAYPKSKLAVSARFNAGVNYERAQEVIRAISMYNKVVSMKGTGNKKQRKESHRLLARLYEKTGQYEKAAKQLESFAGKYPSDPKADESLYNAAVLFEGLGLWTSSRRNYKKYAAKKGRKGAREVEYILARMQERRGRLTSASKSYERFLSMNSPKADRVVFATFKVADIARRLRKRQKADRWYKKTVSVHRSLRKKTGVGNSEAAESKFRLSEKVYHELVKLRIPKSSRAQQRVVKKKLSLLDKLNKEMAAVVKYDDGRFVVAALTTVGKAYTHMAEALYGASVPKGLSKEDLKKYKEGVDAIARPMKERGVSSYREAVAKSNDLMAYSSWSIDAWKGLRKYDKSLDVRNFEERVLSTREYDLMGI